MYCKLITFTRKAENISNPLAQPRHRLLGSMWGLVGSTVFCVDVFLMCTIVLSTVSFSLQIYKMGQQS